MVQVCSFDNVYILKQTEMDDRYIIDLDNCPSNVTSTVCDTPVNLLFNLGSD